MSQYFSIHPETPQPRLIHQATEIIRSGGVATYPTDTGYAIGCNLGDKQAVDRIRQIRRLDDKHHFTLLCKDLSDLGTYARVGNSVFRQLKAHTPGPFTFILEATSEVPRRLQSGKKKTIGLRVPSNPIALAILEELDEPLMSTTLQLPDDDYALTDPRDIRDFLERRVDLIIDGGYGGLELTSVIDLTEDIPILVRQGAGAFDDFVPR